MTALKRLATGAKPKTPRRPTLLDEWFLTRPAPGISVEAFAADVGLSTCRIWALRRGDGKPSMASAAEIETATEGYVTIGYWNTIKIRPAAKRRRSA